MTTTEQMITNHSSLKFYQDLDIKRRSAVYTYEASWYNVSEYLKDNSEITINKQLDFEREQYGSFKNSNISIIINNKSGDWYDNSDSYSLFSDYYSRDMTKVRFTAGYYDENDTKITEYVFEGLLDEKTVEMNYNNGEMKFDVLSYSNIFENKLIDTGDLLGCSSINDIIAVIGGYTEVSTYITYNAGNINPAFDISFDFVSPFENRTIVDVLEDMMQKSNSVWYIDLSNNLIVRDRTMSAASSVYDFLESAKQSRSVNVLDVEYYSNGYDKIINVVKYTNVNSTIITKANSIYLSQYGEKILELSGDDITSSTTIASLSNNIIDHFKLPKAKAVVNTIYMPNIIDYYDKITLESEAVIRESQDRPGLIINANTYVNENYYTGYYDDRLKIDKLNYKYIGFEHNLFNLKTKHFLIEG